MKHILSPLMIAGIAVLGFSSCKKDTKDIVQDEVTQETLSKIGSMGFYNKNVQKVEEGYLVEGDIVLTASDLNSTPVVYGMRVGTTEQYRTNNLVNAGGGRVITVALSSKLPSSYGAALDEMVRRYNAEKLTISFQRVSGSANITFVQGHGSYLASSGFPTSGGDPYSQVKVNSQYIGSGNGSNTFINYLATIFAHEVGHCIGFRHTDYMDRSYSCGGAYANEGTSSVGAVWIANTPKTAEPNSFMLACISSGQNRPFDNYDKIALAAMY
ncbi:M57 family metalloprotease [Flavisolibacter nicotianae]|uniref:M57 family metalloprotease n=1 Tax=Flavisolibacter nicotianae TaxID=2364882 RepID=UPI000EB40D13|nr:M57 family metalloprotease [Flavisolibacter nicotianae]